MNSNEKAKNKVIIILISVISIAAIVFALLELTETWKNVVFVPLLGVVMLIQSYSLRKTNRVVSIISICAAIIAFVDTLFLI